MKIIKIILVIALFLITLALGAENQEVVTFNYLLAKGEFHLSTLLGVVFAAAFGVAWLIFGTMYLKAQLKIKRLNRKLKKQQGGDTTSAVPTESKA
ncbi:LapA family protein [Vibrio maerlii]|uniref:LapA family protein n=1 Tax=Vibrio maerlii TaxID=2231648 RepID=UPI000E3E15AA|nr:lipopolysaccharide assembly protein LapA domain-containing protein [Vibrio maerlii]